VLEKHEDQLNRSRGEKKVLQRVKEERTTLHTMQRKKFNWIGHILRRNCLLKQGKERGR